MSSNQELYNRLFTYLRAVHSEPHVTRIRNWVWIMVGMILSQSVQLGQIALHLPSEAEAAGRIAQIRRWLSNRFVNPIEFYRPLIQATLQPWAGQAVYVILDATAVNHGKLQVLRLSLSHCYRALPLTWLVLAGTGLVSVEQAAALLAEALLLLQSMKAVTFLADRGFRDTDWAEKCLQLGWNYLIRVANNTYVTLPDGRQLPIDQLGVKPGQRRYLQNVGLTKEKGFVCHLMVTWTKATPKQPAELCAVITNLTPCFRTLHDYLKRMHIAESFRDDKSGSVELAQTHLTDIERLNHLLLAVAVVTLWIHEIGQAVVQQDARKEIDPAAKRQLSIFQLGWRKLRRAISRGMIPLFQLRIRPMRLAPVAITSKNKKC
jgi:DDE family transposase